MISSSELILAILVVVALITVLRSRNEAFTLERSLPPNGDYVIAVPSFLSHSECDALIKASEEKGFVESEVAGFRDDDPASLHATIRAARTGNLVTVTSSGLMARRRLYDWGTLRC
jgi:hypothetical protein